MKVILSRKGFDSESGGGPSPIVDGQRLVSLPIEYPNERVRQFNDLRFEGQNLGVLIEQLYRGKRSRFDFCHLDPDVRADSLPRRRRHKHWRPLFGQHGTAAVQLVSTQGVGEGDIFLFFGLFRETIGWTKFVSHASKKHVIFGWLQVDEVIHSPAHWVATHRWASSHPHTYGDSWKEPNVLFVSKPELEIVSGKRRIKTGIPGAGVFPSYHERLRLSDPKSDFPSRWKLPRELLPDPKAGRRISTLESGEWKLNSDRRSVCFDPGRIRRWQEAVISGNAEAARWAVELIRSAST